MRSILNVSDLNFKEINRIISLDYQNNFLNGKNIGLIFEKPSTRTRLSFSVGINQLGGNFIDIKFNELNLSRDESFEDTFRALNCYLDGLIYRTTNHNNLIEAKKFFDKPIINALSDKSHPCQAISDLLTLKEHFNTFDLNILWMGDMNNVCFSLVEAAYLIDEINLVICTPEAISKNTQWVTASNILIINNIKDIDLKSINCVMTDVFVSMNDKDGEEKVSLLQSYSVNNDLMSKTAFNSIFMHCLPAKVGYEVTEEVLRGPKSIVWKQAYNRMVAQKKLLQFIYQ